MAACIHVIDSDYRRRARVSHELSSWNVHVEIYEDLIELCQGNPHRGFVLAADEGSTVSELADALQASDVALPMIVYSDEPATEKVVSAMYCGALDYLQWPFNAELLDAAFRRLSTQWARKMRWERLRSDAKAQIGNLSHREREVLVLLVEGFSNKEMAHALKISPRTVEIHRSNMMRKLNAQSAADAVRIALYGGLDEELQFAA